MFGDIMVPYPYSIHTCTANISENPSPPEPAETTTTSTTIDAAAVSGVETNAAGDLSTFLTGLMTPGVSGEAFFFLGGVEGVTVRVFPKMGVPQNGWFYNGKPY